MAFFYAFVSLNAEQLSKRRQLLDRYGHIAQLSALVPLLLIYFTYLFHSISIRYRLPFLGRPQKEHQSPRVSTFRQSTVGSWRTRWRRLNYALDDEVLNGWDGWGTKREWGIAGLWALWLLVLVFRETGDDYLHLTKRFGIVAASQLPLHYLLAAKSWSPIQFLTRKSHEELNPYHRLLGRILITLFACHSALYVNFYIQSNLLHRFGSQTVILGITAISIFMCLGTSSLAKVRDYSYLLFFTLHVALSIAILPVLWFHVEHLRVYIVEAAGVYILLIIQRNISQTSTLATLTLLPSASSHGHPLLRISFPLSKSKLRSYTPGQHIYVGLPPTSLVKKPWGKLRLNPFTIAAIFDPLNSVSPPPLSPTISTAQTNPTTPSLKSPTLALLIRPLRSSTAILASLASSSTPTKVLVEGPYGAATYFPDFTTPAFSAILLVAGGVGATFTLPIFSALRQLRGENGGGEGGNGVNMIWCIRRREEAASGIEILEGRGEGVSVYVTDSSRDEGNVHGGGVVEHDEDDIELEEGVGLLRDGNTNTFNSRLESNDLRQEETGMRIHEGRPDLRSIVDDLFTRYSEGKIAVLVCGPRGLGRAVRREVGLWVGRGREVWLHGEQFGW